MTRFSDRIGITKPPSLAREAVSPELRVALWNVLHGYMFEGGKDNWVPLTREFCEFHHIAVDQFTYDWSLERMRVRDWWFFPPRQWWEIYNVIDHFAPALASLHREVYSSFNRVFEQEGARYRFVGDELTQVTDSNEIVAVEEALAAPDKFAGAREHLTAALRFLGQRPTADCRNSIRESISAVESTLKVLSGMDHAPLGDALKAFSRIHPIHGALFSGLSSLYGYTSNEHGIRHALIEADANVGYPEAKFMVVACAGFVSFLIAKGAS